MTKWFRDIRQLINGRIFLFDIEGDGGPDGGYPVETSFLEVENGHFVAEHRWVTNPGRPIHPRATLVHGISDDMVGTAPLMEEVSSEIADLVRGQIVVGLAIENDLKMLRKKVPGVDFVIGRAVDVARLSYLAPSGRKNMGLDKLCDDLGIEMSPDLLPFNERGRRHGASADAWLTGQCFFALMECIKDADDAKAKEASLRGFLQMPPSRERLLRQELEERGVPVPEGRIP